MNTILWSFAVTAFLLFSGCSERGTEKSYERFYGAWLTASHDARSHLDLSLIGNYNAGYVNKEYRDLVACGPAIVPFLKKKLEESVDKGAAARLDGAVTAALIAEIMGWRYEELQSDLKHGFDPELLTKGVLRRLRTHS